MRDQYPERTTQWHYTVLDDKSFQIQGETLFFVVVIFSALLVVLLLFLYVRWACRRHVTASPYASSSSQPPQTQGLDAAAIKRIPVFLHQSAPSSDSAESAECCICLGVFEDGEKVKVLPGCCHCYHPECVDRWLSEQPSCPLCRASLRVYSPVLKVVVE